MIVAVLAGGRGRGWAGRSRPRCWRRAADRARAARRGGVRARGRRQALDAAARARRAGVDRARRAVSPADRARRALERGPVRRRRVRPAVGHGARCWRELGEARAVASVDGEYEPFPGYYDPAQLDVLREALREEAGLRRTLARLAPPRLEVDAALVASVNTPEALAAARVARRRGVSGAPDFAVIGGGIVGCSLAAFLAEAGASVVLYEREAIAAGASGRNSGVVQHPLDAALVDLYEESLEHYRDARARLHAARGPGRAAARLGGAHARRPTSSRSCSRRSSRAPSCARWSPRWPRAWSPGGWRPAAPSRPRRPRRPSRCARTRRARRCRSARPRTRASRTAGRPA